MLNDVIIFDVKNDNYKKDVPLIDLRVDLRFSEELFNESFDISFEYEWH